MTMRDIVSLFAPSDFVVTMLALLSILSGGGWIGCRWILWSKRRKAKQQAEWTAATSEWLVLLGAIEDWQDRERVNAIRHQWRRDFWQQRVRNRKRERMTVH